MVNAWYRHPRVQWHDYDRRNNLIPTYTEDDFDLESEKKMGWDSEPKNLIFKNESRKTVDIWPFGGGHIIKIGRVHIHDSIWFLGRYGTPIMLKNGKGSVCVYYGIYPRMLSLGSGHHILNYQSYEDPFNDETLYMGSRMDKQSDGTMNVRRVLTEKDLKECGADLIMLGKVIEHQN